MAVSHNNPLRLVPGGGQGGEVPLISDEDLPLGPLAGQSITAWVTPSSGTCHLDESCAPKSAKPKQLQQPSDGTFAERNWPDRPHCMPTGGCGDYVKAANQVLRTARDLVDAKRQWRDGLAGYSLLGLHGYGSVLSRFDAGELPVELQLPASRLTQDVDQLRHQILDHSRYGYNEQLERAAAATWVVNGRTRGKYQHRYQTALDLTQRAIENTLRTLQPLNANSPTPKDLAGWDALIVELERETRWPPEGTPSARDLDVTEFWFERVADGVPPERATRALTRKLIDDALWRVRHGHASEDEERSATTTLRIWWQIGTMIGDVLAGFLEGVVATERTEDIVVVWHHGQSLLRGLNRVVAATTTMVRAYDGEDELRVAALPATFRPLLEDSEGAEHRFCLVVDAHRSVYKDAVLVAFADALVGAKGQIVDVPGDEWGRPPGKAIKATRMPEFGYRGMTAADAAIAFQTAVRGHEFGTSKFDDSPALMHPDG